MKNTYTHPAAAPKKGIEGRKGRFFSVLAVIFLLLLLALLLNLNIGSVSISPAEIFSLVTGRIACGLAEIFGAGDRSGQLQELFKSSTQAQILFSIRIPRMLLAALLGGALAASGYLLQVFFRNPIAGPFVLGISSGAKMVVGITLIFFSRRISAVSPITLVIAAFGGALLVTVLVLLMARKVRSMAMLLVIGIMIGYICGAVTDFCISFADDHDVANLTNWAMGSFSGADWTGVRTAAWFCLPCMLGAMLLSKPIAVYALGEGYAASMGLRVRPFCVLLILLSSLLSACVTALAGPISFVGIAVPHICRRLLHSSKPLYLLPTVFLCGSVFCMLCDLLARTVFAPTELAIGTVTSIFGAPVVIVMLLKRQREQEV